MPQCPLLGDCGRAPALSGWVEGARAQDTDTVHVGSVDGRQGRPRLGAPWGQAPTGVSGQVGARVGVDTPL